MVSQAPFPQKIENLWGDIFGTVGPVDLKSEMASCGIAVDKCAKFYQNLR